MKYELKRIGKYLIIAYMATFVVIQLLRYNQIIIIP